MRFVLLYRNFIPRMAEKRNPFYRLLKAEVPINITSELIETFDSVNETPEGCLRTRNETTHSWVVARLNDGCKLQKRWLRPHH